MGADLIIATLTIAANIEPDFDAGRAWVKNPENHDSLARGYEERHGEPIWEDGKTYTDDDGEYTEAGRAALREYFTEQITKLEKEVINPEGYGPRDLATLWVRGAWVYVIGGTSWGDSPGEEYDILNELGYCDFALFEAMGFERSWPTDLFSGKKVEEGEDEPDDAPTFNEIAQQQGWNVTSRYNLCRDFITRYADDGMLIEFAQRVADEENAGSEEVYKALLTEQVLDAPGMYDEPDLGIDLS